MWLLTFLFACSKTDTRYRNVRCHLCAIVYGQNGQTRTSLFPRHVVCCEIDSLFLACRASWFRGRSSGFPHWAILILRLKGPLHFTFWETILKAALLAWAFEVLFLIVSLQSGAWYCWWLWGCLYSGPSLQFVQIHSDLQFAGNAFKEHYGTHLINMFPLHSNWQRNTVGGVSTDPMLWQKQLVPIVYN